jgi:riboflavin kinase/FMN adenylyltransferase
MVEGPNFYFGRGRSGNVECLKELCTRADISLEVVEPITIGGEYVSSSRVRKLIEQGQVEEADRLLTRPYRLRGMVTHGASRGHRIGFPTANLNARVFTGVERCWLKARNVRLQSTSAPIPRLPINR